MPISRRTQIIIGLSALALLVVGGLAYYFFLREPEPVVFNTYVCEDGSFYLVLMEEDAIGVAGRMYDLVSSENGMRYENAGPLTYTINGTVLTVSNRETDAGIATCAQGAPEMPPVVEQ